MRLLPGSAYHLATARYSFVEIRLDALTPTEAAAHVSRVREELALFGLLVDGERSLPVPAQPAPVQGPMSNGPTGTFVDASSITMSSQSAPPLTPHQQRTKAADAAADPVAKGAKAAAVRVEIKRMARTSTAAKLQLNYWLQRLKLPDASFEALDDLSQERLDELAAHLEMRMKVPWWPMWDPAAGEGSGGYRCPGVGCGAQMYDNGPDARSTRDPTKKAPWLSCSNKACTLGDGKYGLAIWDDVTMPDALRRQEKDAARPETTDA